MTKARPARFPPVRPYKRFPRVEPIRFDPREATYVPVGSVANEQIRSITPEKITMLGARLTNAGQSISTGSLTAITLTADYDIGTFLDPNASTHVKIPHSGMYSVVAYAEFPSASGGLSRRVDLRLNGTTTLVGSNCPIVNTTVSHAAAPFTGRLLDGDYLEMMVLQDSGSSRTIVAALTIAYLGRL